MPPEGGRGVRSPPGLTRALSTRGLGVGPLLRLGAGSRTGYACPSGPAPRCCDLPGQRGPGPGPPPWQPHHLSLSSPLARAQPAHGHVGLGRHGVSSLLWALREEVRGGGEPGPPGPEPGVFGRCQCQGLEVSARGSGGQVDLRGRGWGGQDVVRGLGGGALGGVRLGVERSVRGTGRPGHCWRRVCWGPWQAGPVTLRWGPRRGCVAGGRPGRGGVQEARRWGPQGRCCRCRPVASGTKGRNQRGGGRGPRRWGGGEWGPGDLGALRGLTRGSLSLQATATCT